MEAQVREVINRKRKLGRPDAIGSNVTVGKKDAKMAAEWVDR